MALNTSSTGGYLVETSTDALNDDDLANLFQTMVVGLTGLTQTLVRPRWQPQPGTQPPVTTNWCAVGIISYDRTDYPQIIHNSDGDGSDTLYRLEQMNLLATFYGPNCVSLASILRDGLYVNQNNQILSLSGVKFRSADQIMYVPELVNTQFIPRADLPISFVRMVQRTYPVKNLLGVEVDCVTDNGDRRVEIITQES